MHMHGPLRSCTSLPGYTHGTAQEITNMQQCLFHPTHAAPCRAALFSACALAACASDQCLLFSSAMTARKSCLLAESRDASQISLHCFKSWGSEAAPTGGERVCQGVVGGE